LKKCRISNAKLKIENHPVQERIGLELVLLQKEQIGQAGSLHGALDRLGERHGSCVSRIEAIDLKARVLHRHPICERVLRGAGHPRVDDKGSGNVVGRDVRKHPSPGHSCEGRE